MLWVFKRTMSAIAPRSGLLQGIGGVCCFCWRVRAAFRDPARCFWFVERTMSAIAPGSGLLQGMVELAAFVGGPLRRDAFGFVERTASAIAAGHMTHMDVGSAASPSGTGAALLQGGGGAILVCPLFPRVCNTHAQMSAR